MLDLTKIKDFSMSSILKNKSEGYTYTQADESIVVSPDKQTIKVTLQSEKNRENFKPFDIIVTKKDDRYWIKSDYFDKFSVLYPVTVYEGDDAFILIHQLADEIMYLHAYYD